MKKAVKLFIGSLVLAAAVGACSYGAIGVTATDKVVVMRQDNFLMGALRKAYVCKITDSGLSSCATSENP